jgi:transcriptional regulator with XRE-family HTH domain
MANRLESLSKYLAQNLSAMRQARAFTQADLAKAAGLPRSTITNLESGAGNPSLANLGRLAEALQVSIEELIARPRADCQLVRAKDLTAKTYDSGRVAVRKLLPDPIQGLEIDRMDLEPSGWKQGVPHLAGTKEYLTCVEGSVTVYVAGENFVVSAGDVLAFPGDQAHSYRNATDRACVCYSVVSLAPRRRRR